MSMQDMGKSALISGTHLRTCRVCGCTDSDCRQCIEATGKPCHWVQADLCSRCADEIYHAADAAAEVHETLVPGCDVPGPEGVR